MNKTVLMRLVLPCICVIAGMTYVWKTGAVLGKDVESHHTEKSTPTRALMLLISSHTSRILDALMIGDHDAVIKESNAVAESSQTILKNFFPEGGQAGEWFKETGKDPKKPEDVSVVKKDFEKYMKTVVDAAKNIAETSRKPILWKRIKALTQC